MQNFFFDRESVHVDGRKFRRRLYPFARRLSLPCLGSPHLELQTTACEVFSTTRSLTTRSELAKDPSWGKNKDARRFFFPPTGDYRIFVSDFLTTRLASEPCGAQHKAQQN